MFEPRLADPDGFYQALLDTHAGLSLAESHALNARLVLILANQVGDMARLHAALAAAREDAHPDDPVTPTP
jgi:hypothetical protein